MSEDYEEQLKIAAFIKLKRVNQNHLIKEITIGPNSLNAQSFKTSTPQKTIVDKKPSFTKEQLDSSPKNTFPTREILKILELERQEKVQNALSERIHYFDQFNKLQENQIKKSWLKAQQAFIDDMEKQEMNIIQLNKQYDLKQSSQHAKMVQQTQNAVVRMKQKQEQLKEKEKQRQVLVENIGKIKENQQKFSLEYQKILSLLKSCKDNEELKASSDLDLTLLKTLPTEIDKVIEKCKGENISDITEIDVQTSNSVVAQIIDFKSKFQELITKINKKREESDLKQESNKFHKIQSSIEQTKTVSLQLDSQYQEKQVLSNTIKPHKTEVDSVAPAFPIDNLNEFSKYVSIKDLQMYIELMEFHEKYIHNFKELEEDSSLKNFRFDCKKAVNIPVNSISGVNSEHIMDKYKKLHRLLSGQSVIVSDRDINASRHPQGIAFCTDLLARKFVLQGDLMVSSNPESAFHYASVILSLWNDFPDFGKLLVAYFYKTCPYLVPYYIPRQMGETDEEFYKKLGYQYNDGVIEKQDKFLKRMTGTLKLYFAIFIAKPRRGQKLSPCSLKDGWKWIASLLKLEPQMDITATALHVFLETVGFEMERNYGRIFQRVLQIILQTFLPKCKEAKCTGGAVTRLELLLTDYLKNKYFEKPNGYVEYAYW